MILSRTLSENFLANTNWFRSAPQRRLRASLEACYATWSVPGSIVTTCSNQPRKTFGFVEQNGMTLGFLKTTSVRTSILFSNCKRFKFWAGKSSVFQLRFTAVFLEYLQRLWDLLPVSWRLVTSEPTELRTLQRWSRVTGVWWTDSTANYWRLCSARY